MRLSIVLAAATLLHAQDSRELLNQGVAAFVAGNHQKAIGFFEQAVRADPNSVSAHRYLGAAHLSLWVPTAQSPENEGHARIAEAEFKRMLELDSTDKTALMLLASLAFSVASTLSGDGQLRKLDEASDWNKRLLTVDPDDKEAYYRLGLIAWQKGAPALTATRAEQDPGPLRGPERLELKARYSATIAEGIANLRHALLLDPQYDDAMALLNLLLRARAYLADTREQWAADIAAADDLAQRVRSTRQMKAQAAGAENAPPPPGNRLAQTPERIHVDGNVQGAKLLIKADAVYPPLAAQANITGIVRFTVIIAKDGTVRDIQLVSGHPLLVASARDAVSKYVYQPALRNGQPVEVVTSVDVTFP